MRTLQNSTIYFNNPDSIYRPGDILTGRIEINFNSTKVIRALYYEVVGKASVYWSESSSTTNSDGSTSTTSTSYTNKETYFKERFYIAGKENTDEKVEIQAGQHVFPFKYVLPSINLPPTFKGRDGKVIYSVRAILDCPWKINKRLEAFFIVETLSNIHNHPQAKEPVTMTMEKQFGIIFKSKPLKVIVKIPNSEFIAGQNIPMTVEVINESNIEVHYISAKLKQITTCHATTDDSKAEITLAKNPIPFQIRPKSCRTFNHNLQVPADVILYDLSNCKIIDIDYVIRVELQTAGFTKNLVGNIPFFPIMAKS